MHVSSAVRSLGFGVAILAFYAACSSDSTSGATDGGGSDAGGADAASTDNDSAVAVDSGSQADAGADVTTGDKGFGEACTVDGDCKSHACFVGGNGAYCSIKCTPVGATSTDCPTPLTTGDCNNKGYCKKP